MHGGKEQEVGYLYTNNNNFTPVTLALDFGHTEMARYIYSVTPFEVLLPENEKHGAVLLVQCYYSKMLGKS